jgi:hypothetical protein
MKTFGVMFICAIPLLLLVFASPAQQDQQQYETITIRSADTNNGVVIIKAATEISAIELQCNKDYPSCNVLKPGKYSMVRLPKNWGRYECANVEVYAIAGDAEGHGEILGAYCLVGK